MAKTWTSAWSCVATVAPLPGCDREPAGGLGSAPISAVPGPVPHPTYTEVLVASQGDRTDRRGGVAPRSAPWLPLVLGAAFAVEFAVLAWDPYDRSDWLLENLISLPVAVALVLYRRRLPFSSLSWCLVFGFLALHEIGSHYTYSRVPWMDWSQALLGWVPWERNHYDRLLHFAFGLMLTRPIAEALRRPLSASPLLQRMVPVCCIATFSMIYELLEWAAAAIVDPALGIAFVGAQGDIWDAQKDMALALGGSILAAAALVRPVASAPSG